MKAKTPDDFWKQRADLCLAQGTGTNSKRWSAYVDGVYPSHIIRGLGPYLYDAWGNRYVDFVSALGANILGYSHAKVDEAARKAMNNGVCHSLPSYLEVEAAELVKSTFPFIEKVKFFKTGSEACSAAVRIARAYTDTPIHNTYSEGYHGWHDAFTSLTPPGHGVFKSDFIHSFSEDKSEFLVMPHSIIVESYRLEDSESRKEWLKLMSNTHAVFIVDEIITGMRVPGLSVCNDIGLTPDLACFGKAIANGYPISFVGGKADIMDEKEWFCSSTFSGETMSLAAMMVTIETVNSKSIKDLIYYAKRFQRKFNDLCEGIGVRLDGYGTRCMLNVDNYNTQLFMQETCKAGLLFGKAFFYNFAHLESNLEERIFNTLSDIVTRIAQGGVGLEGKPPVQTFKR